MRSGKFSLNVVIMFINVSSLRVFNVGCPLVENCRHYTWPTEILPLEEEMNIVCFLVMSDWH